MHVIARALRGHSWLAWLSLLFATQIAAADPVVGPDPEDAPDRTAVHASVRTRPLPILILATEVPTGGDQHAQTAAPVIAAAAQHAPDADGPMPRASARRPESSTPVRRLQCRAPPFFCFL